MAAEAVYDRPVLVVTTPTIGGSYDLLGTVIGSGSYAQDALTRLKEQATELGAWGVIAVQMTMALWPQSMTRSPFFYVAIGTAITEPTYSTPTPARSPEAAPPRPPQA